MNILFSAPHWVLLGQALRPYQGAFDKTGAPDSGKTNKFKMALSESTLKVKGCVAGGLFCRGQNWQRAN